MKRFLVYCLLIAFSLSCVACANRVPVSTEPDYTPIETESPNVAPPVQEEIIPDIEIETLPPAFEENMSRDQLTEYYAHYLQNVDWTKYSGFTCESADINYTYQFTDKNVMWHVEQESQAYKGSLVAQETYFWDEVKTERYLMCEEGSFGYTNIENELMGYPTNWTIINEQTTSWYLRTETDSEIYDVIQFETPLIKKQNAEAAAKSIYTIRWMDSVHSVSFVDGKWKVKSFADQTVFETGVTFDPETSTLTINDDRFDVEILHSPTDAPAETSLNVVRGLMYINRTTQEIAYMEDVDTGYHVFFITNPDMSFTMPSNVRRDEFPEAYISTVMTNFQNDTSRYIS